MNGRRANALAVGIVALTFAGYLPFAPVRLYDLRAFYCAGRAVAVHADPYREHPLHECERTTSAPGMPVEADVVTVPAPLPGYVLALFALLAVLPFPVCALLWIVASLAAVAATILLLIRLIDLPPASIAIAVAVPELLVALPLGQSAPFVGFGIAVCASALRFKRPNAAVAGALLTAAFPAIALPLCTALFIAMPRARIGLIGGCMALCAVSLAVLGLDTNTEYVRAVLHAHALGNVAERSQFSTAHFAWIAGFSPRSALAFGNIWYVVSATFGVGIALRLRAAFGAAIIALIPPAFAVFGGFYVHFDQLVLAIPAYLALAAQLPRQRIAMLSAIFILAVPWLAIVAYPPFAVALVVLAILYLRPEGRSTAGALLGGASAVLLLGLFTIALMHVHAPTANFRFDAPFNPLAERSWTAYVAWRDPHPSYVFLLLQVPTVGAFVGCLAVLARTAFRARLPAAELRPNR